MISGCGGSVIAFAGCSRGADCQIWCTAGGSCGGSVLGFFSLPRDMLGTQTPPSPSVRALASLPLSACPARLLPRTSPAGDSPVPPGTCCAPPCDTIPPCSCARFRQPSGTAGCGTLRSLGVPDAALLDVSGAPEQSVRCCSPCVCRSRSTGRSVRLVRALCRGGLFTSWTCRRESRLHADGAGRAHVSGVLAAPLSSLPSWTSSAASTAPRGRAVRAPSAHCGTACSAAVDGSGLGSSAYGRRRRRTGNRATSAAIRSTGLAASALRLSRNPKGCVNEAPPPPTETASMASERSGAAGAGRVISVEITVLRHRFCLYPYTVIFRTSSLSRGKTTDYGWTARIDRSSALIAPDIPERNQELTITLPRPPEKITVYCYHPVDNSTVIPRHLTVSRARDTVIGGYLTVLLLSRGT